MSPDIQTPKDLKNLWPVGILPTASQAVEIPEVTNRAWASPAPWADVVIQNRSR
jgi:hypothetical protein